MIQTNRERNPGTDDLNDQIDMLSLLLRPIERGVASGEEAKRLEFAIDQFVTSVTKHLNEEEEELKSRSSNDLAIHFAQHRFFATQANLLKIAFIAGEAPLARSVLDFLHTWLNYHAQEEKSHDMAMVSNI